ncbi:hypothetical protein B0T10DRAFT_595375 [Thelonectria olida]|uniref:Uncharacterized protein n=1 Tax=Thelonectria olida TaxID=1576542 RepID=A0A9P8W8Q8_9HYPO|nr:hypothetical protein B0T10DRAFT_595375 [Thelonectria olida]
MDVSLCRVCAFALPSLDSSGTSRKIICVPAYRHGGTEKGELLRGEGSRLVRRPKNGGATIASRNFNDELVAPALHRTLVCFADESMTFLQSESGSGLDSAGSPGRTGALRAMNFANIDDEASHKAHANEACSSRRNLRQQETWTIVDLSLLSFFLNCSQRHREKPHSTAISPNPEDLPANPCTETCQLLDLGGKGRVTSHSWKSTQQLGIRDNSTPTREHPTNLRILACAIPSAATEQNAHEPIAHAWRRRTSPSLVPGPARPSVRPVTLDISQASSV